MTQTGFQSWGLFPPARQCRIRLNDPKSVFSGGAVRAGSLLPVGNGRSYGDSCLNDGGAVLDCRGFDRILGFDAATGVLAVEAGALLSTILATTVPLGWILPVLPGTQYVTVGGAIANDIHGKNHHVKGTFGRHVLAFDLIRSDAGEVHCSRVENHELFAATIGGLGLTGVIASATIQLVPIAGAMIDQEVVRFQRLEEFLELTQDSDRTHEYSVAWIDSLAGRGQERGLMIRGNHAPGRPKKRERSRGLGVPFTPPVSALNRWSLRLFNELYYRSQGGTRLRRDVPLETFFFPLDAVRDWNRLYGPRGLLQHQCVVPREGGVETVRELLARAEKRGAASFLTVLKVFGDRPSPGLLSFPRPGLTLTLDFSNRGPETLSLLDELDRVVLDAGGRVNPYKDARMSGDSYRRFYPDWEALERQRDPAISSSFWRRVTR